MIRLVGPFAAFLLVSAIACGGDAGENTAPRSTGVETIDGGLWLTLSERPLELSNIQPGESCPIASSAVVSNAFAPALGEGPVCPVHGGGAALEYGYGDLFRESEWGGNKVLWVSDPAYGGPVLVRGAQLDGPNEVRFQEGVLPAAELRLPEEPWARAPGMDPGWRAWPSYTRLRAPGCYAYQIDGLDWSEVVVFEAKQAD